MPGTLLLEDLLRANQDDLSEHVQSLFQPPTPSDSLTNPLGTGNAMQVAPVQEPVPQGPTPSDTLTNPPVVERTPQELQDHVAELLASPPPTPEPAPAPAPSTDVEPPAPSVVTQLADHVADVTGGSLKLLGQGLTSLGQGAQQVAGNVISLTPPSFQPSDPRTQVAPPHDPSTPGHAAPVQSGAPNAAGQVFPLAVRPDNQPTATYHSQGGSDLMAPRGTPVLNMQSGKVVEVYQDRGDHQVGGNAVLIHGDDGLDYYYAHFDQPTSLRPGDAVQAGQQIGAVGNSGNAWKGGQGATHLHIGIGHGISNGVGSEGGLGLNFNAQQLLIHLEDGVGKGVQAARGATGDAVQRIGQGKDAFVDSLSSLAQQASRQTGIDPSVYLAIAANETGWGKSKTAQQQNNLFSIQGNGANGSRWAGYDSPQAAFDAFNTLISSAPRYARAWADRTDPVKFIDDLRNAGYVVDEPGYPAQGWVDQVNAIFRDIRQQVGPSRQDTLDVPRFMSTNQASSTDQHAAEVDQPRPLQLIGQGWQALGQGAQGFTAPIQSPDTGNPVLDVLGTGASAVGTGVQAAAQGLRNITPTSELARGALGQEQLVSENRDLFDQQQRLVDEFAGAQARGDQAAMDDIRTRMDDLQAQLPDARNRDVLHAAAERNPSLPLIETGANVAGAAAAAPLAAEGLPLAARAAAAAIDPATGLPAIAGRALEEAEPLLRTRQRAEGINPFNPPPLPGATRAAETTGRTAAETAAEVERLRLDKFPEWLQGDIEQAARATDFAAEQRRGVIPDAQAEAMADQLGRSVDDWIAQSQPGKIYNTEETRALRNLVTGQAQRVQDLTQQVSVAASRGEVTDRLIAEAAAEGEKLQALTTVMEGNRAEWGRAGRAWQAATRLVDLPPSEAISQIYKELGGRDNALAAVQAYNDLVQSGATPLQLADFWAKVKNPPAGWQDWLKALRYNSMLSGPRTVEVNAIGNGLEIPWRLTRDIGASVARGRPEEIAPEAAGIVAGLSKANRAFMETLSHGVTTEQALAGELPTTLASRVQNPVGKAAATAIDVPSRVLAAGDAWGKAVAQSMALGRRAGVTASNEGLRGDAWNARVAELLANPSADMLKEADAISERMVYHGDMGSMGSALAQFQRVPVLGNMVLPFLRTVYHITARGIDRSPVGAVGTAIDVGRGAYGPRTLTNVREQLGATAGPSKGVAPLGERLGDNLMGSAATAFFFQKAMDGNITGAGPDDREKRDMLRAQGWQPYSIKLGDHYVSYANWGPVAEPLAMAAAAAEAWQYRKQNAPDWGAIGVDAATRTAKLVTEQSYLQGIGAIWKALDQPDRYSAQALGQAMTSLVPYGSALNTIGQAMDPLQRQVGKVADVGLPAYLEQSLEARLPGLRENVPAAQDQLGRPVPNEATGVGALNPLRTTTIRQSPELRTLLQYGVDVGEPPTDFRGVPLTPDEQRTVNATAGPYIERNVRDVQAEKGWATWSEPDRTAALQKAVDAGRRQAVGELVDRLGTPEFERRLKEAQGKKQPVPISGP